MTLYIDTKPTLEWIEYNGRHIADRYQIKQTLNGSWLLMWTNDNDHYHDTIDQAKAAAQADYEACTAVRFRAVEVRDIMYHGFDLEDYEVGYNQALEDIHEAIAKAKDNTI
jgi:methionine synthase II (cobalamin-independent)